MNLAAHVTIFKGPLTRFQPLALTTNFRELREGEVRRILLLRRSWIKARSPKTKVLWAWVWKPAPKRSGKRLGRLLQPQLVDLLWRNLYGETYLAGLPKRIGVLA
jgi:hypothetical protein